MPAGSLLLVEGADDMHVILSLLAYHRVPENFRIEVKEGVEQLLETFPVYLKSSGLKSLGIVLDADTDLGARWAALIRRLDDNGYRPPREPHRGGTILETGRRPRVGVWVMPDNALPGMLEDFVQLLIPAGDPLIPRVRSSIDGIPGEHRRFPPERHQKAVIHTWLAWQDEPGKPMGQAITARYLDPGSDHACAFVTWIRLLFPQA